MTVRELIEHLQQYPQDASVCVLYQECSDYSILEADEIHFYKDDPNSGRRYVLRNGQVMEYDPKQWPPNETPVFLDTVIFPGN